MSEPRYADGVVDDDAVASIMHHQDGEAVVHRGRVVGRGVASVTVELDHEAVLPSGTALALVVHGRVPIVSLATLNGATGATVTLRLAERRG